STGSPASRRFWKRTPLTTRPASTSRQGITRTATATPSSVRAGPPGYAAGAGAAPRGTGMRDRLRTGSWTSSIGLVRDGELSQWRGWLARGAVAAARAVATATLAGCRTENADTDCSADACTITFLRGAEASAEVLGV